MEFSSGKEILEYYRETGMELWVDDGRLKYKAPKMSFSDEHLQVLKKYRGMIIDYLERKKDCLTVVINKDARFEPFPMSDVQTAYLLGRTDTFQYSGVACHVYLEINYDELDAGKTGDIWNRLIARHEMLRAVMNENGYQQIMEWVPELDVPYIDAEAEGMEDNEEIRIMRKEMSHRMYELGKWPMFGIAVSKHNKGATLHFSMEFLIADWTSIWLLLSEFEALYFTPEKALPEFELSFRDYILTERGLKDTEKYEKDKAYWLKEMETLPSAPELPLKRVSDVDKKPAFKRFLLKMDIDSWRAFKNYAQKCGITPTVAVLTAYADVIERWSRNKRFCINLTVLNRLPLHPDMGKVVGDFTTVSLLAVDESKNGGFAQRAKEINEKLFENLDHRLFTGIELLRELARKEKKASLMPVVFTSAIGLISSNNQLVGRVGGYGISQTPQVFIDCQAMDGNFGLQVNWDVREDIFPEGMAEDMFQAFESRLDELSDSLDAWYGTECICIPGWQMNERKKANDTKTEPPKGLLYSGFVEHVQLRPWQLAVDDGKGKLTYRELDELAKAIAFEIERHGGRKQDRIAVVMEKSRYQVAAVLGILYMGGIYVPVDAGQAELRKGAILDNVGSRIVLTLSDTNSSYKDGIHNICVDAVKSCEPYSIAENEAENPAYIIYTSGSTGMPKGVVITHKAALNTIEDINRRFQAGYRDKVLGISQLNFDLSVYDIFGMLSAGGSIIYPEQEHYLDPAHWAELMEKHRITIWNSVPALMRMLLTHLQTEKADRKMLLRLALLSGDWIPLDLPDQLREQIPRIETVCMGGATEASIWSIYHRYDMCEPDWVSIPYGRPLANQSFLILDRKMNHCPVWVPGEIYIAGEGLAEGYYGDAGLTEERFVYYGTEGGRMYRTGDMGRYLPGGGIEFLGREDCQVKIRGHRIELGEIECAINKHPSVAASVAYVNSAGNEICAVAEPALIEGYSIDKGDEDFNAMTCNIEAGVYCFAENLKDMDITGVMELRKKASLTSLLYAFQSLGLLKTGEYHDLDEMLKSDKIMEKYRWLIRPWVYSLERAGFVSRRGDKSYGTELCVTREYLSRLWDELRNSWIDGLGSVDIVDYIRLNAENLTEILKGTTDPLGLLFTEVGSSFTRALYADNSMAAYLNMCICEFVKKVAAQAPGRKLRILEIGAGSGSTTEHVLNCLKGFDFEYFFTDASKYFFSDARKRFGHRKEVTIRELNIDRDYLEQGFAPNSFDIVIGAYVLENAKDIEKSIERIEDLLMPQGYLLFSAPLRDEEWLLVSQALMMTLPEDALRYDRAFMEQEDWLGILQRHGDNRAAKVIPEKSSKLSCLGLNLFIKQFKRDREKISSHEIKEHASLYLPDYMVPCVIQLSDRLPLTANGKIDRGGALKWAESIICKDTSCEDIEISDNELEIKLSSILCDVLMIEKIGSMQNFYDFGADSLIMAQAATKIRNQLNIRIPFEAILRQILNHPTISELGQFILEEGKNGNRQEPENGSFNETAAEEDFAYIRTYGGDANIRMRVLVHGALGSVNSFRYLGPELAAEGKGEAAAIGIRDLEKYCSLEPKEAVRFLADHYTQLLMDKRVKKVQLIGYSFSGVIAVEIAERLIEQGVEVEDVVVIDGGSMPVEIHEELMYELLFVENINVALWDLGFKSKDMLEKVFEGIMCSDKRTVSVDDLKIAQNDVDGSGNMLDILKNSTQEERFAIYKNLSEKNTGSSITVDAIMNLYRVFKQSFKAMHVVPDAYFGDIRYFSSKQKEGIYKKFEILLDNWKNVCLGHFSMEEIEGNHYSCVEKRENAVMLAKLIGRVYEEYEQNDVKSIIDCSRDILSCDEYANSMIGSIDEEYLTCCTAKRDNAIYGSMLNLLQKKGLFVNPDVMYDGRDVIDAMNAEPRQEHVMLRWLKVLSEKEFLKESDGKYYADKTISDEMLDNAWKEVASLWNHRLGSPLTTEYLLRNIELLPELINGNQKATFLLFPEGKLDYANALYKETFILQYLNRIIAEAVIRIGNKKNIFREDSRGSLRILEIGAGTGATTDVVIPYLKKIPSIDKIEYVFTDISKLFLQNAKERYVDFEGMEFRRVDIDKDLEEQGVGKESADIIISVGVLNNACNTDEAVRQMLSASACGGWLLIVEPVMEVPDILVSQAFMMIPPQDDRRSSGTTFLSAEQWRDVFERAGASEVLEFPKDGSFLNLLGQKLFMVRK